MVPLGKITRIGTRTVLVAGNWTVMFGEITRTGTRTVLVAGNWTVLLGTTPERLVPDADVDAGAAVVAFVSMPGAPTATAVPLLRVVTPLSSPAPALVTVLQLVPFHCSTSVSSVVDMVSPTA